MNYAQQLLQLEEDKEKLLKQSRQSLVNHYFCFVNLEPVEFFSSKDKDISPCGTKLTFEIIAIDNSDNNHFYSVDFVASLNVGKNNTLVCSFDGGCNVKLINQLGIFLIQNFSNLNKKQKTNLLENINTYYEYLQKKDDENYVRRLNTYHIIDYFISENYQSLEDFIVFINQSIPTIVEQHLSSFVSGKPKKTFGNVEPKQIYQLSIEDKNNLIEKIQSNFYDTIKDSLYKIKKENNYQQEWEIAHNQTVDFFNAKEFAAYKYKKLL